MNNITDPKVFVPGWGARLTQVRKSLKKTQAEIGECVGVRNTAVSKWEQEASPVDERSLKTLEYMLGISPDYIIRGEGPLLVGNWNEGMRASLIDMAGSPINGVWTATAPTGMEPVIQQGDVVIWTSTKGIQMVEGAIYLAEPKGTHRDNISVAPANAKIGQAFPVEVDGEEEWFLYRLEDRTRPGKFPPISLRDRQVIGRAVAYGRRLNHTL